MHLDEYVVDDDLPAPPIPTLVRPIDLRVREERAEDGDELRIGADLLQDPIGALLRDLIHEIGLADGLVTQPPGCVLELFSAELTALLLHLCCQCTHLSVGIDIFLYQISRDLPSMKRIVPNLTYLVNHFMK